MLGARPKLRDPNGYAFTMMTLSKLCSNHGMCMLSGDATVALTDSSCFGSLWVAIPIKCRFTKLVIEILRNVQKKYNSRVYSSVASLGSIRVALRTGNTWKRWKNVSGPPDVLKSEFYSISGQA